LSAGSRFLRRRQSPWNTPAVSISMIWATAILERGRLYRWATLYSLEYNETMRIDAIPHMTSSHAAEMVPVDHLLDRLIAFFDLLPAVVRREASLLIAVLCGDEFVDLNEELRTTALATVALDAALVPDCSS